MSDTCCEGCNRPDLPWAGRGTDLPISGCRFTLYPMCDNFIDIILGGLERVDTSAVWSETDALSTVYRGKLDYVMDAVSALFASAWTEGVHMAIEGQVSKGCPGDVSGDSKLTYEGEAPNHAIVEAATQPCLCKLALYPMGVGDYIDVPLVSASNVAAQQSVRFLLAHFDPYYQCGDSAKGHHIAFIASAPVAVAKTVTGVANDSYLMWNTANTNQGTADVKNPYLNSNLKAWEKLFEACLPEGLTKYLLTQRMLLEERYSANGALSDSNSWSWQDIGKVWSPSEMEVYGCPVWGTKGYSVGFDCQFDLFRDTAHRLNGTRYNWWLRSVMGGSSSDVCYVYSYGYASCNSATYAWVRPRPGFLVG